MLKNIVKFNESNRRHYITYFFKNDVIKEMHIEQGQILRSSVDLSMLQLYWLQYLDSFVPSLFAEHIFLEISNAIYRLISIFFEILIAK